MTQRTCTADDCGKPHLARGWCLAHYTAWRRRTQGREDEYVQRTCISCGSQWETRRRDAKFCSDMCKGQWYSDTMRTKCKLPLTHPVMLEIGRLRNEADQARERDRKAKSVRYTWRTARECPACGCHFTPLHTPNTIHCSRSCGRKHSRRRRRAREHGAAGSWVWSDFMRIAAKFGYCCAYCGTKPDRLDPDHVVPISRGGYDSVANLLPACPSCNRNKSALTLAEWADWRHERGLSPLATSWAPEDKRYHHLTQALLQAA